jgi:acetyl esterase
MATVTFTEEVLQYLHSQPAKPPVWQRTIEQWREDTRNECLSAAGATETVRSVETIVFDESEARLYRPIGGETDVLVWMHGGGWIVVDLDCCDALARTIANRAGCAVLSVGYRRAPEAPYPAAIEDCWVALRWANERFKHLAVGGDSAGGNLAAVIARRARDEGIDLALQLLIYPVLDWRTDSSSYEAFVRYYDKELRDIPDYGTEWRTAVEYLWETYIPDPARRVEIDASPLRAPVLAKLAPAYILTAEHDIFRHEDEEYADRLISEGVPVEFHNFKGQVHGFYHLLGEMSDARVAVEQSVNSLKEAFRSSSPDLTLGEFP